MKYKYIVIEREYGSGGTKIARRLSQQTGIACYGEEILKEVSREIGIPVEKIQSYEENATNSFLYSIYMLTQVTSGKSDMLTGDGHIYVAEQAVIQKMAANAPAIFLGHCACEALKGWDGVLTVFIRCTDAEAKMKRIEEEYGIPKAQAEAARRKFDKKRANYYYANTEKKWDDLRNYDIVLDSGKVDVETSVNMLKALLGG